MTLSWRAKLALGASILGAAAMLDRASAQEGAMQEFTAKSGKITGEMLTPLSHPWKIAVLPDDRLLITEKPGNLRLYADGKLSDPIAGVPKVHFEGQGGLLSVVAHPGFATNNTIYLSYAEPAEEQPAGAQDPGDPRVGDDGPNSDVVLKGLAVARAVLDGTTLKNFEVIWRQEPKQIGRGHFGGHMVFSGDEKLFITNGDRQRFLSHDPATNAGKVVRINPDGSLPADNMEQGPKNARKDVWSTGHRNPLGIAFDPATRNLWLHEMGPLGGDELNLIAKGADYGWPAVSNGDHYDKQKIPRHDTRPEFVKPVVTWTPVISPAGLTFYTGSRFSGWTGKALIGGLSSKAIVVVDVKGETASEFERIDMGMRIRDVVEAGDGSIYVLKDGEDGGLMKLSPNQKGARS
jgi:glucose/arabinose dehydrogenase